MPGCGAVVFFSDDNDLSWYRCGGVEKLEAGRFTYDGRKFRIFFLTSFYDREGKNWVKEDKKVSLDHRLFQGYGVKALSMKTFDARGNGTEFQMLDPEKFLSKTNGYRVTGSLPVVDSAFMLSRPLVQFNSPADQLAAFVMRYTEEFARLPAAQQVDRVFALPAPVPPSDRQGRDAAEQSSEATDYDDGAVRYRAGPQHRSRGGAGTFDDEECEGQDGKGGGWDGEGGGEEGEGDGEEEEGGGEADDGNEGDAEGEDDGMDEERDDVGEEVEDNRSSQFHRRHHNKSQGRREDDACRVGDAVDAGGQPAASRGMSQSYDQTKDGRDEPDSRGKRKRGEASTSPASRTKQARADAVNEARGALTASQEARAPQKTGGGGRSGSCGGGRGGGRKGSQRSRAPELRVPRRLGGVEEARQGAGLGPTKVMYKKAPFHFKVFIYTTIDKLDMLRAEVKRIASSARHLVWDKLSRQTTLLPVCMRSKEVMVAPVDIVAATQKMACKAAIVDISAANFSSAWTSQDFNALYAMMAKCCGPNWVERAAALESMDVDSREDAAPVPEAATGNTMGEQREDGGTTFGVKLSLPEAGNTPAGKNTIGAISVATGDTSQGEKVSLDKPADGGATYGSLLATSVALAGTSEMVSESTTGMGVTGMLLHPPTCTSKGDAHCTTTPQGGVTGEDENGGNAGGSPRSRNIEDMTTDDEDGVEGGKGVSDPTRAENEG
ncbi:hypothetical protein CBR_g44451 [Chara braunii]|uniref:Uncharacterized protein n=1 Tax=Chara braunii TaxID=69332 RepID=A0A388LXG0_CHABU|nr:hypothetical protein CBR_g44451 [Chara braunii]|eukprot:GBG86996.1 hypothetical protein CBR_g44451 [Chara braunii]